VSVPRYDRDGLRIDDGPRFGPATRQHWETNEERDERLTSEDSQLDEARQWILEDVGMWKGAQGKDDEETPSAEEMEERLNSIILGSAHAARQVLPMQEQTIEQRHRAAFLEAMHQPEAGDVAVAATSTDELTGDSVVGTDALGNTVYRGEDGEAYILADSNEDTDENWEEDEE
jgi:hypothetical protein